MVSHTASVPGVLQPAVFPISGCFADIGVAAKVAEGILLADSPSGLKESRLADPCFFVAMLTVLISASRQIDSNTDVLQDVHRMMYTPASYVVRALVCCRPACWRCLYA